MKPPVLPLIVAVAALASSPTHAGEHWRLVGRFEHPGAEIYLRTSPAPTRRGDSRTFWLQIDPLWPASDGQSAPTTTVTLAQVNCRTGEMRDLWVYRYRDGVAVGPRKKGGPERFALSEIDLAVGGRVCGER